MAVVCVFLVFTGSAVAGIYAQNKVLSPGEPGGNSGWNTRTWNEILFDNPWGGLPQMGSAYWRTDLTTNGFVWSNTGYLYDDRDMAYGYAECRANVGNNYNIQLDWCWTN